MIATGNRPSDLTSAAALALALALLPGCTVLGNSKQAVTAYAPDPRVAADPAWPAVTRSLELTRPLAPRVLDSLRIAVRPTPGELQVYKGANWAASPADQLEAALLRTLEDSGRIAAVGRQGSGLAADYRLATELRRYEADYAGQTVPSAVIEVNAKLLSLRDQRVVASHTFLQSVPATASDTPAVADAFGQALAQATREIAGWVLGTVAADTGPTTPGR